MLQKICLNKDAYINENRKEYKCNQSFAVNANEDTILLFNQNNYGLFCLYSASFVQYTRTRENIWYSFTH